MAFPIEHAGRVFSREPLGESEADLGHAAIAARQSSHPELGRQVKDTEAAISDTPSIGPVLKGFDFGFAPQQPASGQAGEVAASGKAVLNEPSPAHTAMSLNQSRPWLPRLCNIPGKLKRPGQPPAISAGDEHAVPPRKTHRSKLQVSMEPEHAPSEPSRTSRNEELISDAPGTTRFSVPLRRSPDRLTQPFEMNPNTLNMRRELERTSRRHPFTILTYGNSVNGSGHTAIAQANIDTLAAQRGFTAITSGFNMIASQGKKSRYTNLLDSFLQEDIKKFNRAKFKGQDDETAIRVRLGPNDLFQPSKAYPRQDTLILTRDKKGNFHYDMDKVAKLANSNDPAMAEVSLHAKDIMLADHIANEVAGKQRNRSLHGVVLNSTAATSSALLAATTHGASATAEAALRATGYGLAGVVGTDPASMFRGYKKSMREKKDQKVKSAELINEFRFAEESKNGFKVKGLFVQEPTEKAREFSSRVVFPKVVPVSEVPEQAIEAVKESLHDQAVRSVERKNYFGGMWPGRVINENKTALRKKQRREDVAGHAYTILKEYLGTEEPAKVRGFVSILQEIHAAAEKDQNTVVKRWMERDLGAMGAYQLIRDFGMGRDEARALLVRTMEIAVEKSMQADTKLAPLTGQKSQNIPTREKDEIIKPMADAGKRR